MTTTESPKRPSCTAFEPFGEAVPHAVSKVDDETLQRPRCCNQKVWAITLIVVRSLSILGGLLYGTAIPAMVTLALEDQVVYCSESEVATEKYLDPYGDCDDCSPYDVAMYMLNATNAEEYLATNAKLQVREMGPYVYRRRDRKLNVTLSDDASTASFKSYTYHTFVTDKSCTGCYDTDAIVSFDTEYFSAIAAEFNLLATIAAQSFALNASRSEITAIIGEYGEQMMRWLNGLNSLDAVAMMTVTSNSSVLRFLTSGPDAISDLDLSGFAYNALFVKRTASQWACSKDAVARVIKEQCGSVTGQECIVPKSDLGVIPL